jgi:hypothetical protein
MRRLALIFAGVVGLLWVAAPASAFAHDRVANPYAHAALDALVLAVVSAPIWTVFLWGGRRRGLLVALVTVVQIPVAVAGFVPIVDPGVHAVAMAGALTLTAASVAYVRRAARKAWTADTAAVAGPV